MIQHVDIDKHNQESLKKKLRYEAENHVGNIPDFNNPFTGAFEYSMKAVTGAYEG